MSCQIVEFVCSTLPKFKYVFNDYHLLYSSLQELPSPSSMGVAERRARLLEEFMGEERPKMRAIEEMRKDEFAQYKVR